MKLVLDTNTVISALLFRGKLASLVAHWQTTGVTPLLCEQTHAEFRRVLSYPKFKLSPLQIDALESYYLPYATMVTFQNQSANHLPQCRDKNDQMFLELAFTGKADFLVTGDEDLLILKAQTPFEIITPLDYLTLQVHKQS
jgi:uncharacterized protein